ncbi:MAG: Calx-beta domain-containing protein [Nostoc sp. ChiSLP02]|nr:Calx-beta domain-containing protein [Nostoc sp. DedSLP05]MDZ8100061.1 Calx-beta domain-containing protein [Nostoc sp. DedSLP01]MDZ8186618.1 Calx-beta domain-containing protein [Nostoc sp. ChiSLP02]
MKFILESALALTYNQLGKFSNSENFWNIFATAFGTQYDRTIAQTVRSQSQVGDFSQLPKIEIIDSGILGNANGVYASSTNKIYLSEKFVSTATPALISAVLLEEIGHFVDAQINQKDPLSDEGELFSALVRGQNLTNRNLERIKAENDWQTITIADQNIAVEQATALNFSVTFNDPSGTFSSYYSAIQSHILAAGSYWDNYIEGNANLEVIVNFTNPGITVTGRSFTSSFVRNNGTFNIYEQGATAEIRTGNDPNGVEPDIEFNFNADYLRNELWFDSDPLARITPVPNDRTDALSVLLHEFGHAFAFNGWRNSFNGTFPGDYQSTFDEQTIFDGNNFFFVGTQATSVYGSFVPVTFGNATHIGNDSPRPGSDLISDLMNGVVYYRGNRYNISPLDIAILKDSGVPIAATTSNITLAVNPVNVNEDGSSNLVYTFTRSGSTTNALTVNYGVGGTATFNSDYTQTGAATFNGTTGTITFAAGATTVNLIIDPIADTTNESNETVALTLNIGTGYTIGTTTPVTGTITNDDLLSINLGANQTIVEGNTSPQNVSYKVSLSQASSKTITVQYATANGTARAGLDYTNTSGTLTFNPGETSKVINIPILNDSLNEANETFTLNLASPTNASLGTTKSVTTTITDTLTASATTTLPTNVENLTLTGTAAINGTGNAGNNILKGNSGNNILSGGAGNDTYSFLANSPLGTDTIRETTTGGTDTIDFSGTTAAVNVNLGLTTSQTVNSNLKLILSANNVIERVTGGTGNDRLTGNSLNNNLIGGNGNDQLQGLDGNDNLQGGSGNDTLIGGAGDDILWGELGNDILTGNAGKDKYQFQGNGVFNSSLGDDYITQFEVGQDQIVLSKSTFNAITNNVGQTFTDFAVVSENKFVNASKAHIVYSKSTGSLFYNQDGNLLGTGTVFDFATIGNPNITLSSSNFSLIA